jgi:hypothetical protein
LNNHLLFTLWRATRRHAIIIVILLIGRGVRYFPRNEKWSGFGALLESALRELVLLLQEIPALGYVRSLQTESE